MEDNKISARLVAKILGVSRPHVYYLVDNGDLKPLGRFGNQIIFDRDQVNVLKARRDRR